MTERERIGWGWTVVVSFLLLAAALGGVSRCQPDEGTYVPAPAHKPSAVEDGSASVDARCERAMGEDATAGKGPAKSLIGL